jgi:hypothetical protein
MLVGYARVSATHQNMDRQLALLKAAGCKRVFREKLSGREGMKRPGLEKAIEALGPGDVLVLAEWDRATRSMLDGIRIIERVAARGATFKALDRQWLDLTTPLGKGILAFLSALAEDERGRMLARANGGGPPPRNEASNSVPSQSWLRTSNAKPSAWCGRARAYVRWPTTTTSAIRLSCGPWSVCPDVSPTTILVGLRAPRCQESRVSGLVRGHDRAVPPRDQSAEFQFMAPQ